MKELLKKAATVILPKKVMQYFKGYYYYLKLKSEGILVEPELKMLDNLLSKGGTFIDIGANYGRYTKALSKIAGYKGHVLSFEPIPTTFHTLQFAVQKLKLRNVKLHNTALSDFKGESLMEIPTYLSGGDNYYEARLTKVANPKSLNVKIKCNTLDGITSKIKKVDFIKIDVEGHELEALNGGEQLINTNMPLILIEINGELLNGKNKKVVELLETKGYKLFFCDDELLYSDIEKNPGVNYFALTKSHQKKLKDFIA
ncbi:MAG: FkbM family methyltransferase [Sphingobacteriales bacterium]|jgi:FkbM family methyltransferase